YGPTHSQTLEKLFLGTPGLRIFAPNIFLDPGELLLHAIFEENDPVLFVENKIQYSQPLLNNEGMSEFNSKMFSQSSQRNLEISAEEHAPTIQLTLRDAPPSSVTIVTYGYIADLCRQAALRLAYEDEIIIDIIVFSQLLPINNYPIFNSIRNSHRLLIVEEGTVTSGWGAEVIASCIEKFGHEIHQARRVASLDVPIPASSLLERELLPDIEDIIQAVKKMV
ncbi:MAG TPA: transketolase C-terminal domain-containing protein, partial [Anaerolineales bacterium]|nr:transketolase C-terminal domain-containing protein [Anaerolineales bacterium]